ncbi:MAG: paraslipin, partial [Eubacterium sp.]|nr:paraslipin [Eubacterium sp.]
LDFPPQPVITKDNVTMMIDSVVFCYVFDPKLYTYGIENPIAGLQNLSATTLRNIIGDMELDQTLTSRETINGRMQAILDEATDPWGIKVTRVEIKNIQPPKEIEEVMTKQMRAERERRQTVLEAQAHQEAVVSRAEGDKKAKILAAEAERDAQIALAEGRAKSIRLVYEAEAAGIRNLNDAQISESVLKLKGIEALKEVSDGRATKIYMPSDIASAISSLGVVGEAMGIGDATPIDKSPKPKPPIPADPCITSETSTGGKEAAVSSALINSSVVLDDYKSDDYQM